MKNGQYVVWFSEVGKEDIDLVGGKGANLGEMTQAHIPVPPGFIVTAKTYFDFLDKNKLREKIKFLLTGVDVNSQKGLIRASSEVKRIILDAAVPEEIANQIMQAYLRLSSLFSDSYVAVRSSATAEDLPDASFAGQQVTFLNVKGESNVVRSVQECWASLFEPRAIFYRKENNFDHFKVGIAVPVQKMVQSEVSGVMFTIDPLTNNKKHIVVESVWGLGELIVQGSVTPDHYVVHKDTLELLDKELVEQKVQLVRVRGENKEIAVSSAFRRKQKIPDNVILEVAKIGKRIENHYFFPQDIEWAYEKGKIYIVQTRPVTTIQKVDASAVSSEVTKGLEKILSGSPAAPGIGFGPVKAINDASEIDKVLRGDVLVTGMTTPDFVPAMRRAVAIVTDKGGRTCHAAIVSRELGVPCVVGTGSATKVLKSGTVVTVNGGSGEIFKGGAKVTSVTIPYANKKTEAPKKELKTATKIYLNLAEPSRAWELAAKNVNGIGLLRAEFMIAEIGTHPKKLIRDKRSDFFIQKLGQNLRIFCEAFNPRPVVYRATDFKTNEYRNLAGGADFEPEESNPMLGYRGCYRYISDPEVFLLELEAIKLVRNKYGLKNLWLMLPFVRTVRELVETKKIIAASGLSRSPSFKLWLMVEIPSNVILLEQFIDAGIDGISIGSNDLTMLILGTDRDNSEVATEFDERDPAVLWALERAIKTSHKYGITSSICGQAPSVYPELTEKLVEWGITSVSVAPDVIESTRELVYQCEKRLAARKKT